MEAHATDERMTRYKERANLMSRSDHGTVEMNGLRGRVED
jgi:hypothetical protein